MDITSSNSTVALSIPNLIPTAEIIQQFASDEMFDVEDIEIAEVLMGIDGNLSGGKVYVPIPITFNLQADSKSIPIFETWYSAMAPLGAPILPSQLLLTVRATGAAYMLTNGIMTTYSPAPSAGKTLKPRKFKVVYEAISNGAPL